jgi:hypothetical protein
MPDVIVSDLVKIGVRDEEPVKIFKEFVIKSRVGRKRDVNAEGDWERPGR